ncbi:hypothetical protein Bca101_043263 [Brassica carinata]
MDRGVCDKHSPRTFRNFVELSQRSYYDKVPCHKIIKDFIVQGGDPTGTGRGGQSIYEEKIERWIIKNWKQRTPRRMALFTGWYQEHYVCLLLHEIASNRFVYRLVPKIKPSRRDAMMHQYTEDAAAYMDHVDDEMEDYLDEDFHGDDDMPSSDSDVDEFNYFVSVYIYIYMYISSITTSLNAFWYYENVPNSDDSSGKDCMDTQKGAIFYDFWRNSRSIKSSILHFQLRNLVWETSKHDVYLMSQFLVSHYSTLTYGKHEVLNVQGHVSPSEKHPGSSLEGFTKTQVSTLALKDKFLVAGGFQGELICKHLDRPCVSFCSRTIYDDNAITNATEIYNKPSGALHFTASNNDCGVRDFDMERYRLVNCFHFPWPVNVCFYFSDGKLLTIVGDNPEGHLLDPNTGKTLGTLAGHLDFSFASAWHPDGITFSTGNHDKTCRVWDIRNLSKSVAVLRGNLGAIRSICYTSDGTYMAMAEPLTLSMYTTSQKGTKQSKRSISLGRSREYPSALTQRRSSSVFGTVLTAVSLSMAGVTTTPTLIHFYNQFGPIRRIK